MRRSAVALVLPFLLLAACGGDDDPVVSGGYGTTASTTTSTTGSTTTSEPEGAVTDNLPATGDATTTRAYLKAVRVASQDGFDRVVFEFEDALPGYRVAVTQPPVTEDGSGDEVGVDGSVLLEARFENAATARLDGERVVPVYSGPDRVKGPKSGAVAEVVDAGDFEGVVTWVIGLRKGTRPPVEVTTMRSPYRIVVDVRTDS